VQGQFVDFFYIESSTSFSALMADFRYISNGFFEAPKQGFW
jgi:hypothetical protein